MTKDLNEEPLKISHNTANSGVELKKRCDSVYGIQNQSTDKSIEAQSYLVEAQAWRIDFQGLIELVDNDESNVEGLDTLDCVTE